jgi:hypothetical protein
VKPSPRLPAALAVDVAKRHVYLFGAVVPVITDDMYILEIYK